LARHTLPSEGLGGQEATRRWGWCLVAVLSAARVVASGDLRLVEAVKHKDTVAVHALVQLHVDVNTPERDGATALHWAVHWDDQQTADMLIRAGANVNISTELGVTPLALACANGNGAIVGRLLAAGANPNKVLANRPPALMLCARTGSVDGVKALVAHGADVNAKEPLRAQTALMWAVAQQHPEVVRVLLQHGADVRARSKLTRLMVNRADPNDIYTAVIGEVPRGGSTALLFAARHGDTESAKVLLEGGADVNDAAPDGASALVIAAHSGHRALATLLLDQRANPNGIGAGYTALHAAVLRGDLDLVNALLAHGAVVDALIRHGTTTTRATHDFFLPETLVRATPFALAAKFLELDIMRVLAAAGADPRLTLKDGTTPLMLAAGLLSQTSLFDRRDRVEVTRLPDEDVALQAVRLTIELGAGVNAVNERGDTALHGVAAHGYTSIVQLLVQRGASLEVKNRKGETPLKVSSTPEVKALLHAFGARE